MNAMPKNNFVSIGEYAAKAALIALILYLIYDVFSVFMPVAMAVILAFTLQPLVNRLSYVPFRGKKVKVPDAIAILAAMFIFLCFIIITIVFVILPLFKEINNLMLVLPKLAERFQSLSVIWNQKVELLHLPSDVQALLQQLLSRASSYSLEFLRDMLTGVFDFAKNILGFVVMPIFTFYFLKDGRKFAQGFVRILPAVWQPKAVIILKESAHMLSAYIRGIIRVGIVSGCVISLGTYLIGLDYPLVFGILAVFAEAVPIVGPIVSMMPALFFAYIESPDALAITAIFYLIYYKLDAYIIAPKITGESLGLHPVIIILSVLVGGKMAGPLGILLAVPAVALLKVLARNIMAEEAASNEEQGR